MNSNDYALRDCLAWLVAASFVLSGCAPLSTPNASASCSNRLGSPIANFCEVKPNVLWRGSKPDKDGAAWLIDHGIRTIVNLEWVHDDLSTIRQTTLSNASTRQIEYFRVKDWEPLPSAAPAVEDEHVVHFLAIASQQAHQPVYVHCRSGQNRTGVMVAAYKIIIDGETNIDMVIEEMRSYHGIWADLDSQYIRELSYRRDKIFQRVKAKLSTVEKGIQIVCEKGKCA